MPYIGNEAWTSGLADRGVLSEADAWRPWYLSANSSVPSGYVTTYSVVGDEPEASRTGVGRGNSSKAAAQFTFATFRLAGHEVPHYVPEPAFAAVTRWLAGRPL